MLLRFSVENTLCFKNETSISLVASNDDKHKNHVYSSSSSKKAKVLRIAAVYGANGHGKTKIVEAASRMKRLIVLGTQSHDKIIAPTFELSSNHDELFIKYVMEFRVDANDYEYGIVFNSEFITEEWLYQTDSTDKEHLCFERQISKLAGDEFEKKTSFGSILKKLPSPVKGYKTIDFLNFVAAGTRVNQPLITEFNDKSFIGTEEAYNWFASSLEPVSADSAYRSLYDKAKEDQEFVDSISNFMRNADVGIDRVGFLEQKFDLDALSKIPPEVLNDIKSRLDSDKKVSLGGADGPSLRLHKDNAGDIISSSIVSYRRNDKDEPVMFSLEQESAGTRRLIDLIPMLSPRKIHKVYIVDELDRKLHPILARKFIEVFLEANNNQLIYTTHNTYLLDLSLLRRDEIWFVQKKDDGSSDLYSLADLKIRPDLDVRKGYLLGRFGAVPFAGNVEDLGWTEPATERQ